MPQPLLLLGTQLCSVPLLPPPKRFRVESQKRLRPIERRNHTSGLRLPVRPALSPWQKREPCGEPVRERSGGITFHATPALAGSQLLSAKQEGTHSREAGSPADAKGPSKQGPRRAPGAAHLEISTQGEGVQFLWLPFQRLKCLALSPSLGGRSTF